MARLVDNVQVFLLARYNLIYILNHRFSGRSQLYGSSDRQTYAGRNWKFIQNSGKHGTLHQLRSFVSVVLEEMLF